MPDCTRCRCPLPADSQWAEHASLEHCVRALGKKVNPEPQPSGAIGWLVGAPSAVPFDFPLERAQDALARAIRLTCIEPDCRWKADESGWCSEHAVARRRTGQS